ncbi:MAG TPA: TetR/AcrR family transcriptional regulator [Jiangellaceae bacterium]
MAYTKTPRQAWIDAGLAALGSDGPDSVRVESLARTLGVTKGGFYGYFANRRALLDAMLDYWEHASTQAVTDQIDALSLDAGASVFQAAQLTWAPDGLRDVDLAIRDWARRDDEVAQRLARVDRYRLDYLRRQMSALCSDPREAEARSIIAYLAAIGIRYAGVPMEDLGQERQDAIDILTTPGTFRPPWNG